MWKFVVFILARNVYIALPTELCRTRNGMSFRGDVRQFVFQPSWVLCFTWKITLRKKMIDWRRGVGGWQWNCVLLCSLLCYLVTHAGDKFLFLCHCLEESIRFKEIYAHESYCHWNNLWKREYFICLVNLLKPTGYVMLLQFNIQQLYVLPTLYLCVLYLSENKQRLVPLTA